MYVQRNIMGRSLNVYTSSAILTARYYFNSKGAFLGGGMVGDLISLAKIKLTKVFFCSVSSNFARF
jgi:hypothetical protein